MFEKYKLNRMTKKNKRRNEESIHRKGSKGAADSKQIIASPDSYEVFKKIVPLGGIFLFNPIFLVIGIPVCIVGLIIIIVAFLNGTTHALFFLAIPPALVVCNVIINGIRFKLLFIGWDKRLPFALIGWDRLIKSKRIYSALYWTDVTITVNAKNRAHHNEMITAALEILCKRAMRAYYTEDISQSYSKNRIEWATITGNSVTGSVNPEVLRHIKSTLQKEFSYLARRHNIIHSIEITIISEEYEIPIYIHTSDGPD